ncbi:MAG: hypothetical protein EAX87_05405 [Candidatus Thorarchaeota archaeon]|nr:hypothetical protein [Candidatus Thorarchaeota archaeon]
MTSNKSRNGGGIASPLIS